MSDLILMSCPAALLRPGLLVRTDSGPWVVLACVDGDHVLVALVPDGDESVAADDSGCEVRFLEELSIDLRDPATRDALVRLVFAHYHPTAPEQPIAPALEPDENNEGGWIIFGHDGTFLDVTSQVCFLAEDTAADEDEETFLVPGLPASGVAEALLAIATFALLGAAPC